MDEDVAVHDHRACAEIKRSGEYARKPPADSTLWSARDLSGQPTQDASHVGISASVPSAQATTAATKDCMLDVILAVFLGFRRFLREFCSRRM